MRQFQRLALILLLGVIVGMAGLAVRQPTQSPQQDKSSTEAHQEQPAQEGKESLWHPSTYEPITVFTGALVVLTAVLAGVAVIQIGFLVRADKTARITAKATARSVKVARKQAKIAESSLAASQRPWITVEVKIAGPMTYDINGANFEFDYIMTNVGSSPAMRVFPNTYIYSKTKEMPDEGQVLKDYLGRVSDFTSSSMGFTIGPNAQQVMRVNQLIPYGYIRAAVESYKLPIGTHEFLLIHLVGIVAYISASSLERHETSFYYDIRKLSDDPKPRLIVINTADTLISVDKLCLEKDILFSPHMT